MNSEAVMQDISRQRKMADILRQKGSPQGQMVSGHYVAPSWTQQLASALNPVAAAYIDKKTTEKETDYGADKNRAFADILAGRKPLEIQDGTTQPMQAPERTFDQFGSPVQGQDLTSQPQGKPVPNMRDENPQELMARREAETLAYMQKYGNSPESQYLLGQLNKQDNRAYAQEQKLGDREYAEGRENEVYDRSRADKLEDVESERKYQDIVRKATQGHQITMQEKQFAQQFEIQRKNQQFTAGQNAQNRSFQAQQGELNRQNTLGVAEAKNGLQLTKGQEEVDKEFAKSYAEYKASGGFADINKQIAQLKNVSDQLGRKGNALTGAWVGNIPDSVRAFTDPNAVNVKEQVEEVVQRNLRIILGAQFTQKEGERLIARAYNPRLEPAQNKRRVDALLKQMIVAAETKDDTMKYFEQNGTMKGWGGKVSTMADFDAAIDGVGTDNVQSILNDADAILGL